MIHNNSEIEKAQKELKELKEDRAELVKLISDQEKILRDTIIDNLEPGDCFCYKVYGGNDTYTKVLDVMGEVINCVSITLYSSHHSEESLENIFVEQKIAREFIDKVEIISPDEFKKILERIVEKINK